MILKILAILLDEIERQSKAGELRVTEEEWPQLTAALATIREITTP